MQSIYQPAEDSHLFADFLKKVLKDKKKSQPNLTFLDMGTGSGVLAKTARDQKITNITTIDINPEAVKLSKKNGFKGIHSNLFSKIPKEQKYDIICFNAPYLPFDPNEPKDSQLATTGGKRGDEIALEFLKQAKQHLNPNAKIYLLISSLTPIDKIKKHNPKKIESKKIFFEELIILEIS
jgi:release factor glutamine methyltransferase